MLLNVNNIYTHPNQIPGHTAVRQYIARTEEERRNWGLGFLLMYITGFLLIIIQSSCIGMDCSRELHTVYDVRPRYSTNLWLRAFCAVCKRWQD